MFRSIRSKIFIVFLLVLMLLLALSIISSRFFLEKYYIKEKKEKLVEIYNETQNAIENEQISSEKELLDIDNLCRINNVQSLFIDGYGNIIFSNVKEPNMLKNNIYGLLSDDLVIIQDDKNYNIMLLEDDREGKFLIMNGTVKPSGSFIMRVSVDGIRQSISTINVFLFYLMTIIFVIGIILIIVFSNYISRPIKKITKISQKMGGLDFSEKCEINRRDEIGVLSDNLNKMASKIQSSMLELKRSNDKLKEDIIKIEKTNQKQLEFIGNVSHELKTPIAIIKGYAEGLKDIHDMSKENIDYYVDVIDDEASNMEKSVKRLLKLNQIESIIEADMTKVNLTSIIKKIINNFKIYLEEYKVTLTHDFVGDVFVYSDYILLEHIITNYLTNAIIHSSNEKKVRITHTINENKVRVTFYNTADLLSDESMEKIWDRFYKVDTSHTRTRAGHGIGLSIVKASCKRLGEKCGVKNANGGVEFYFESTIYLE